MRARSRRLSVTATKRRVNAGVTTMRPLLRAGLVERGSMSMTIGPVLCDSSAKGEEASRSQRHCTGAGAIGNVALL